MYVAGLYGFYGPGPNGPKDASRWPAILPAVELMVAVDYVAVPHDSARRRDGLAVFAGYLPALGNQGPRGGHFRLAHEHVPSFAILRRPRLAIRITQTYPPR